MKKKLIVVSVFCLFSCREYTNETIEINEVVTSKDPIYLKEVTWGLTDGSQILYIGFSKDTKDTSKEMLYNMPEYFLYKFENDTLFTYVRSSAFRKGNFESQFVLKETILDNIEMLDLLGEYKEQGLKKFIHSYDKHSDK